MNKKLFLAIIFVSSLSFGQTKFNKGFKDGYEAGYCHNQGLSCVKPMPPIAPIPNTNESSNSYNDGYNRGFELGLSNRKNIVSTDRARFEVAEPKYLENSTYKPPVDLMIKLIAIKDKHYKENQKHLESLMNYLIDIKPYIDKTIKGGYYLGRVKGEYSVLESMLSDDLPSPSSNRIIKERELSIRQLISEYKSIKNK